MSLARDHVVASFLKARGPRYIGTRVEQGRGGTSGQHTRCSIHELRSATCRGEQCRSKGIGCADQVVRVEGSRNLSMLCRSESSRDSTARRRYSGQQRSIRSAPAMLLPNLLERVRVRGSGSDAAPRGSCSWSEWSVKSVLSLGVYLVGTHDLTRWGSKSGHPASSAAVPQRGCSVEAL